MSKTSLLSWAPRYSTVNSHYSGHCRDITLVSTLARVRDSQSLILSNLCNLFLLGIQPLSVLGEQGELTVILNYSNSKKLEQHSLLTKGLFTWRCGTPGS